MSIRLESILVENFKSYEEFTRIPVKDLSVFMGANSSGKSTALQTLLAMKQTMECNSPDIDLLLSGKYVTLGDFEDAINNESKGIFRFGVCVGGENRREEYGEKNTAEVIWSFSKADGMSISLDEIAFLIEKDRIQLSRRDAHLYDIVINGKRTSLTVGIYNLIISKLYINYNREFNETFYNFLNELFKCFYGGKTVGLFEKKEIVTLKTLDKFYLELLRREDGNTDSHEEDVASKAQMLAGRIKQLIEKYCMFQFEYYKSFESIPVKYQEVMLTNNILAQETLDELQDIILKYEKKYEMYTKDSNRELLYDFLEQINISNIYRLGGAEKGSNTECDLISDAFMSYNEILRRIIAKIFYVGPIREKPQGLYNVGFETIPKYVGTTGAYFASVLLRENKTKEYILPDNECEEMSLLDALDEWAIHLNVASEIKVEKKNSFGFSVSVSNTQQKKSDIMNVGIGTSQVLPVLITGLLSEEGEYLFFEQPELHLHPYSQSRLADFFIELVKRGRKVIIETHSEYFVLRMRYQILVEKISEENIIVNFFQNKCGTKIYQGVLSGYGTLQYPEDFRDETQRLLDDLMNAALMKRE